MLSKSFTEGIKEGIGAGIGAIVIILTFVFGTILITSPRSLIPSLKIAFIKSTVSNLNEELNDKPNMSGLNMSVSGIINKVDKACRYNKSPSSHIKYRDGGVSYRTNKQMYKSCLRLLTMKISDIPYQRELFATDFFSPRQGIDCEDKSYLFCWIAREHYNLPCRMVATKGHVMALVRIYNSNYFVDPTNSGFYRAPYFNRYIV